ncbi:hypothetical protein NIA71_07125 [Ihubacter massiliensis]|uniref:Uncharacterized protein n=1 Tax=Hominibacterium faecale TaxID=2839743 RepID=A0A9J6QU47_9FIRM|nr:MULTISPECIES: hypothetical protein [Eubacteriales Family XIII. Incertae Sedis]MCO7121718.1 hypothetical protein [Ihubacter massiliensis]MCU7379124.1 hypothetical protein [Hominibacterium faecale]
MYRQLKLMEALKNEYQRQKELVEKLEQRQQELPHGSLSCKKGCYYRVISEKGRTVQIPIPPAWKGADNLKQELAEFQYIKKALPLLKNNVCCCEKLLKKFKPYDFWDVRKRMASAYAGFNSDFLLLDGDLNPETWKDADYPSNPFHREDIIHESENGLQTRSKAEAMIATKLEQNKLIFRYEPELILGSHVIYPDFCIPRSHDRKLVYWEHFGKMDDPAYAGKALSKLDMYSKYGYFLGDNLIMTWETKAQPLTFKQINDQISMFLS